MFVQDIFLAILEHFANLKPNGNKKQLKTLKETSVKLPEIKFLIHQKFGASTSFYTVCSIENIVYSSPK
jgi:hypothetical protein